MKIICTQENLKNGLAIVSRIVGGSATLPILNNLLLEAKDGQLNLSATNLEIAIKTTIRCKIEEDGSVCVGAKILSELVASLPNENISLIGDQSGLTLKTEHYSNKLKTLPPEEFPIIPAVEQNTVVAIEGQVLKQALEQVVFAVSTNQTQPEIAGVLFSVQGKTLKLVATDRYRLAEKKLELVDTYQPRDVIIPAKTVQELVRLVGQSTDPIQVVLGENQLVVLVAETELISRLTDGKYPDYEQIIPVSFTTTLLVPTNQVLGAIKTSGIFSHAGQTLSLGYDVETQQVVVSASSHDVGESHVEVQSEIQGGSGTILFNYRYLLDMFNSRKEPKVLISIVNDSAAVIMSPASDQSYRYLVMPIKT